MRIMQIVKDKETAIMKRRIVLIVLAALILIATGCRWSLNAGPQISAVATLNKNCKVLDCTPGYILDYQSDPEGLVPEEDIYDE